MRFHPIFILSGGFARTGLLIPIFLVSLISCITAQKSDPWAAVDSIALQMPGSSARTATGIAEYISARFMTQTEQSRAAFIWVAENIRYDVDNMFAINFYQDTSEIIEKVLKKRKGVCMHYAGLFNELMNEVGIKSYVVAGYTRQNGTVNNLPHAWCAALIDSTWCLFDPTWGSGYVRDGKFVREVNNDYYKARPEQFISSHMPFDPLWQLLYHPLTNREFYEGKAAADPSRSYFNYPDSLKKYEQQSEMQRLVSSNRRIEGNGVINSLIADQLQHNKEGIAYFNAKKDIDKYNAAVNSYNYGIDQLNQFISYRNRQFTPEKPDSEIRQMVDTAEYFLTDALRSLGEVTDPHPEVARTVTQLNTQIHQAMATLNEQKAFLERYFRTPKMSRRTLFYR
jgi:hypothetical protein